VKEICLSKGLVTIVDDSDYETLAKHKWFASFGGGGDPNQRHAARNVGGALVLMHRFILNPPSRMVIDHINGDGLDNRRENLRVCTQRQNCANQRIRRDNTSGYKGVYFNKRDERWVVQIRHRRERIFVGSFKDKNEAALAYNVAAVHYHGEFARLNVVK
jgi:hypothetical protein